LAAQERGLRRRYCIPSYSIEIFLISNPKGCLALSLTVLLLAVQARIKVNQRVKPGTFTRAVIHLMIQYGLN
jgi:hypothetical protein